MSGAANVEKSLMRDLQIRQVLKAHIAASVDAPLIIDEWRIWTGDARADIAVINGSICGYEIKAPTDSLRRLKGQVDAYNVAFQYSTLVASSNHLSYAQESLPEWWGVMEAEEACGEVTLQAIRSPRLSPQFDIYSAALCLWHREALSLLESLNIDHGVRSKPITCMVSRLVEHIPEAVLLGLIKEKLKARKDWRAGARRKQCGGLPQQSPTSEDSPDQPLSSCTLQCTHLPC